MADSFSEIYNDDDISFHHTLDVKPDPSAFKMHTHTYYEMYFFISGKGVFHIEGSNYSLHPGDILLMRPAEAHYIEIDPSVPYERAAFHFSESIFSVIDPCSSLIKPFTDRLAGELNMYRKKDFPEYKYTSYMNTLFSELSSERLRILSAVISFLVEIQPVFEYHKENSMPDRAHTVSLILHEINGHLTEELSLESLCSTFYMSKSQMCRIFKKNVGSTIWAYITAKRLLLARDMLISGMLPTQVYTACGFKDYSVFYKAYKKHFGKSPKCLNKTS